MNTEVLPLRHAPTQSGHDCATHPLACEILKSFRDMFAHSEGGPEHGPLELHLAAQAEALAAASGATGIAKVGPPVTAACAAAVSAVARRRAMRQHDMASLVAIVRQTVDSLIAGHAASSAALGASTMRLEGMQHVTDFSELKQLLAAEVVTLRQIAIDREQEHDRTVAALRERLETAETQLSIAREEARIDPLTDAANRRAFDAALTERVKAAQPSSTLILALFDIDDFKSMNDTLGHPVGDEVLKHVARRLRESVRQDDLVARIGGDEFALIASGFTLAQAEARLRAVLHRIAGERIGQHGRVVSLSCGVSEHSAGDTVQTLISRTDAALQDAKAHGKNRVVTREAPYIRSLLRPRR